MERREHVQQSQVTSSQVTTILCEFKQHVAAKYPLEEMRLFGSTVRGESQPGSDIDVFLRLPHLTRVIEEDVYDMAYELELKYDCLIDVILLSDATLQACSHQLPLYQNVLKEGVIV